MKTQDWLKDNASLLYGRRELNNKFTLERCKKAAKQYGHHILAEDSHSYVALMDNKYPILFFYKRTSLLEE